jgi:hypothetical protein
LRLRNTGDLRGVVDLIVPVHKGAVPDERADDFD